MTRPPQNVNMGFLSRFSPPLSLSLSLSTFWGFRFGNDNIRYRDCYRRYFGLILPKRFWFRYPTRRTSAILLYVYPTGKLHLVVEYLRSIGISSHKTILLCFVRIVHVSAACLFVSRDRSGWHGKIASQGSERCHEMSPVGSERTSEVYIARITQRGCNKTWSHRTVSRDIIVSIVPSTPRTATRDSPELFRGSLRSPVPGSLWRQGWSGGILAKQATSSWPTFSATAQTQNLHQVRFMYEYSAVDSVLMGFRKKRPGVWTIQAWRQPRVRLYARKRLRCAQQLSRPELSCAGALWSSSKPGFPLVFPHEYLE